MAFEIEILRAEKEHAFGQTYDLEWQRNLYATVTEPLIAGDMDAAMEQAATLADRRNIPFGDRTDPLTEDFRRRRAERQARIAN